MANIKISGMAPPAAPLNGLERFELAQSGATVAALLAGLSGLPRGALLADRLRFVADTGSVADSDPGAGLLKWNNATPASASFVYLDDLSDDADDLTAVWAALTPGGFLYLEKATDLAVWQKWEITAVTDAIGYAKLAVTFESGAGAWVDEDDVLVTIQQPNPTAGLGDVEGPAGAVSGHLASYDGTSGKLLEDSGIPVTALATNRSAVTSVTSASGVVTLNYALGDYFTLTLTENVTSWVISNPPGSGKGFSLMVQITQGSSPYTVADPGTAPGGSLTVSTGSGDVDVLAISSFNNGTTLRSNLANDYS